MQNNEIKNLAILRDAQAIDFMCKAQTWLGKNRICGERIGYVVKEALPDIHQVMDENKIVIIE